MMVKLSYPARLPGLERTETKVLPTEARDVFGALKAQVDVVVSDLERAQPMGKLVTTLDLSINKEYFICMYMHVYIYIYV